MIIAATGHRPDKISSDGYGAETSRRLHRLATDSLKDLAPEKVISGMALGWDQAVAHAAIDLDIPVLAAIPHEGHESRWPFASQKRYHAILKHCDEVVLVTDGPYAAWKMQIRNQFMVDRANVLLALWNGGPGGTANCVNYARKHKVEVVNLWGRWLEMAKVAA